MKAIETPSLPDQLDFTPLSENTRKERRALLLTAILTSAVTFGGLAPSRIDQLGITFSDPQLRVLVTLLLLVGSYFWVEFWLHSRVEKVAWRRYVKRLQSRALPSLFDRFSALEVATRSFNAEQLHAAVDVLHAVIVDLEPLIDVKVHSEASSALTGYSRLVHMFSSSDLPRKVVAQVVSDLDELRFPATKTLGSISSWQDYERRYVIATSRILETMVYTLGHRVGYSISGYHRRDPRTRYLILKLCRAAHQLLKDASFSVSRELSVTRIEVLWQRFRRLPTQFAKDEHEDYDDNVIAINEDIGELKRFEQRSASRNYPNDWLHSDVRWVMTSIASATFAFSEMERALFRTFKNIETRAWFDLDLPLIVGAALIIGSAAHVWLAA